MDKKPFLELKERNAKIREIYFATSQPLQEIANQFGVTRERIRQIATKDLFDTVEPRYPSFIAEGIILQRDFNKCRLCEKDKGVRVVFIDNEGEEVEENLVTLCQRCRRKVNRHNNLAKYEKISNSRPVRPKKPRKIYANCKECGNGLTNPQSNYCNKDCRRKHMMKRTEMLCSKCHKVKPISEFYPRKDRPWLRPSGYCKPCHSKHTAENNRRRMTSDPEYRERFNAYHKQYAFEHPRYYPKASEMSPEQLELFRKKGRDRYRLKHPDSKPRVKEELIDW